MAKLKTDEGVKIGVAGCRDTVELGNYLLEISSVLKTVRTKKVRPEENPMIIIVPIREKEGNYEIVPKGCEIAGYELQEDDVFSARKEIGKLEEDVGVEVAMRSPICEPVNISIFYTEQREKHPRVYAESKAS